MSLLIRRAIANDADFVAWTILTAQRGHRPRGFFDLALDRPNAECQAFVRRVVLAPVVSQWHVSTFWIAERNGESAAALCALPILQARTTVRAALDAASVSADELSAIGQRGAYSRLCWTWGHDGNWMIEHVATKPAYRGQRLVQKLIAHALAEGQTKGFERASIAFYIGNDVAERVYEKAGFRFAEEKRDAQFEALTGAPGFRRFERAL